MSSPPPPPPLHRHCRTGPVAPSGGTLGRRGSQNVGLPRLRPVHVYFTQHHAKRQFGPRHLRNTTVAHGSAGVHSQHGTLVMCHCDLANSHVYHRIIILSEIGHSHKRQCRRHGASSDHWQQAHQSEIYNFH